jgi:transposase
VWSHISKTWQFSRDRISFVQPDSKPKNVTLYGAITESKGIFSYHQCETTNIENFVEFVAVMKRDELNLKNAIIVMDNHSSHQSHIVKNLLAEEEVEIMYLPPYCSELNPIEKLWALMKQYWKKEMMTFEGAITENEKKT